MIWCGGALDLLDFVADSSVDMVLCDPPYGITRNAWDKPLPFDDMWAAFHRVAKPSAAIVLFAAQPFATDLIVSNRRWFRYDLIWTKNLASGFLNAKKQPMRAHEHILVFYREPPEYVSTPTGERTYGATVTRRGKRSTNYGALSADTPWTGGGEKGPTSVLGFKCVHNASDEKIHPTQKPVDLMRWLIASFTEPGELVLDPTCGSGSTGVAAIGEGRRFLGIEADPAYASAAAQRLTTK